MDKRFMPHRVPLCGKSALKNKSIRPLFFLLLLTIPAIAQNHWDDGEINAVFDGVTIDITPTVWEIEAREVTSYDFGRHLLRRGKAKKAREWFQTLALTGKDQAALFGLTWIKWQSGNTYGALLDCAHLLQDHPSPLIQARTFYLVGSIHLDQGDSAAATSYLIQAYDLYTKLDRDGGRFLVLTMLARVAVHEGDFDRAEALLERACRRNEKIAEKGALAYSLGRYHEIIAEMAYGQGNQTHAASAMMDGEWAYRKDMEMALADEISALIRPNPKNTNPGQHMIGSLNGISGPSRAGDRREPLRSTGGIEPRDDGGSATMTAGGEDPDSDQQEPQRSSGGQIPSNDGGSATQTLVGPPPNDDPLDPHRSTGGVAPRDDDGSAAKSTQGEPTQDLMGSLKITVGPCPGDENDS